MRAYLSSCALKAMVRTATGNPVPNNDVNFAFDSFYRCSPVAVSDVIDKTLTIQGPNQSRLVRLQVQRENSNFILLSHQKSSLVPLKILNQTVSCHVWVRQWGQSNWQYLPPVSGCPFILDERNRESQVSVKFGRITSEGTQIFKRLDLNLASAEVIARNCIYLEND
jgi:hypothetical protein